MKTAILIFEALILSTKQRYNMLQNIAHTENILNGWFVCYAQRPAQYSSSLRGTSSDALWRNASDSQFLQIASKVTASRNSYALDTRRSQRAPTDLSYYSQVEIVSEFPFLQVSRQFGSSWISPKSRFLRLFEA